MTTTAARLASLGKVPVGIMAFIAVALTLFYGSHQLISWASLAAAAAATWELSALLGRSGRQRAVNVVAVLIACLLSKALLSTSRESVNEFLLLSVLLWTVVAPIWLAMGLRPPKYVVAAIGGFIIVSAWLSVAVLAEYDRWALIAGIVAVVIADTAAWIAGKGFGRHPLAPKLSPNKTWEGVLGALLALYLLATILWWTYLSESYPHWLMLLVAAATCGLVVIGDLVESSLKRQANVKDSGRLMGSHGGMLDRIDSWLAVLPFIGLLSTLTN